MAVILITVIGSSDHDQITMGIETLRNIVIITTNIFAVQVQREVYKNFTDHDYSQLIRNTRD